MTELIRELRATDRPAWDELWAGYLRFYRGELDAAVTDLTFRRLCDGVDGMFGLVAVDGDDRPVGLSHAIVHPSTWSATSYTYLEDLFVSPAARGGDVARRLIEATAAAARERGSERLYWQTQQYNGAARSLYDTVGQLTSFVVYEKPTASPS